MNEDKSARYHRLKRRADVLSVAWSTVLLIVLLVSGWMLHLRDAAVALSNGWHALAVIWAVVALFLIHEAGSLPIAWYTGFVLERRYGMARQGSRDWLRDHLKGTALGLVLALVLATIVYTAMRAWPTWWWLAAGAITSALIVLLANLAPVLLLPIFFRLEPLDRPSLRARLEDLARRAGARVVGVFRWELGAKTSKANAALTGIGPTRRILIADTMLDHYSEEEIEVVLAHELAHHVHHDIWAGIALETVLVLAGFALAHGALVWLGPAFGLEAIADPAGLPLLLLAAGAVSLALLPIALALSRRHERRADRFALDLTRNPAAFTSAMRRLGAQNLAEEQPSRLVHWLFYTHPPLAERLDAAARWR
jgi:STE24 endopeptidase